MRRRCVHTIIISLCFVNLYPKREVFAAEVRSVSKRPEGGTQDRGSAVKTSAYLDREDDNDQDVMSWYGRSDVIDTFFDNAFAQEELSREDKAWPLLRKRALPRSKPDVVLFSFEVSRSLGGADGMSVHVTYEDIYAILVFLCSAVVLGMVAEELGMPALVGNIIAGFLLGPPLADFVPYAEAMVLVGEIGLIMLLLEAGVEVDIGQLKQTGTRALAIAITGTTLPLAIGMGIAMAGGANLKAALAVGASFSPTSLAVAGGALASGAMQNTPVGQLIVAACVVDDIMALILLSMFSVLVKEGAAVWEYFIPFVSAIGFLLVLGWCAVTWMPKLIQSKILPRFRKDRREMVIFLLMGGLLMAYLPLLYYTKASYLTGAFLAGLSFSQIHIAHHAFMEKTKELMTWLLRIFFAATIGFQVPVKLFSDPFVIAWGFAFYAAVLIKAPLGFYVPHFQDVGKGAVFNPYHRDVIVTGVAMTCRGEMSFIIAAFALAEGLFTPSLYAAIVWAVLLSCVTSPLMLLYAIKHYNRLQKKQLALSNPMKAAGRPEDRRMPLHMHIQSRSKVQWGMQEKFRDCVLELGLEIVDHRTDHQRGLDAVVVTDIYVCDNSTRIEIPTIEKQRASSRAIRASSTNLAKLGKRMNRISSRDLQQMDKIDELSAEEKAVLGKVVEEGDLILRRCRLVQSAMLKCINLDDATVTVEQWNPWDWSNALDTMSLYHHKTGKPLKIDFFMNLFDKIDTDHSGSVDADELQDALKAVGIKVTKEGLVAMMAMVDENNDGEISRNEWKDAIDFYIEQNIEQPKYRSLGGDRVNNLDDIKPRTNSLPASAMIASTIRQDTVLRNSMPPTLAGSLLHQSSIREEGTTNDNIESGGAGTSQSTPFNSDSGDCDDIGMSIDA